MLHGVSMNTESVSPFLRSAARMRVSKTKRLWVRSRWKSMLGNLPTIKNSLDSLDF